MPAFSLKCAQGRASSLRKKSSAMSVWRGVLDLAAAGFSQLLGLGWVRFGLVGLCATAAYAGIGLGLVSGLGLPALPGNALAFALSFAVSYLGQSLWTFRICKGHARSLPRFALVQALGLGLNSCIVWLAMLSGANYPLAMLLAILICPPLVYMMCRIWVFGQPDAENEK